jgi:hypothetical protein
MKLNFFLNECTHLRYFIPLVKEGNNRGFESTFFIGDSGKYNSPFRHGKEVKIHVADNRINLRPISQLKEMEEGITFFVDPYRDRVELSNEKQKKVILTYMTDFTFKYKDYVDIADHIVLPSKYFADVHGCVSEKNLYLGCPKYDTKYNAGEIHKKYKLSKERKKAFVILPRQRDIHKVNFKAIYESLRAAGLDIITKTRGKDPYLQQYARGDHHFMDFSWYPHDSMELMHVSDLVINFSSTAIKECVLLKKPVINFHIKPFKRPLDFLYNYDYCVEMNNRFIYDEIQKTASFLLETDLSSAYNESTERHLFTPGNSSKEILDTLCEQ